jgi:hypothetical protein
MDVLSSRILLRASDLDRGRRSGSEECLPKRDECAERGEYPNVEAG